MTMGEYNENTASSDMVEAQQVEVRPSKCKGFIGEYSHTLDSKGRVIIPARFRDELGERFVVSKGMGVQGKGKCLFAYSIEEFDKVQDGLNEMPMFDPYSITMRNHFRGSASEVDVDKQGRACIPPRLRQYANIGDSTTFVGDGPRIIIWDSAEWERQNAVDDELIFDAVAAKYAEGFKL
ncbi:MAG: division/cell wall cluster transcriptional repressor MraZ [Lachnospiraceae bacterium]|jgi:MraZ protein|nr:division/cell wall cluster transcriptional repressor MraZ [Lachnospiraceae bacterium]